MPEPTVPVDTCSMAGPNGSRIPTEEPHAWVSRKGPDNIWVRTCHRCPAIDWDDLREGVLTYAATLTLTPSPASMGGPLSEAERLAEIKARVAAAKPRPETNWRKPLLASGEMRRHAEADVVFLLAELDRASARVGVLDGQLAKAADPVNGPVQLAIHRAVCEDSLAHCVENRGRCVRSAEAASWALGLDGGDPDGTA